MGYLYLITGLLLLLSGTGFLAYKLAKFSKFFPHKSDFKEYNINLYVLAIFSVALALGAVFINLSVLELNSVEMDAKSLSLTIIGGFFFFLTLAGFITYFVIYYYQKNIDPKYKKIFGYLWVGLFILTIAFFTMWLEGGADYFSYPLIAGFSINETGFHWTTYLSSSSERSGFHIQFYALCILSGALFVYFLNDHKFYQKYGRHGMLESTFFVAFPSGIIGSRIWYVVGNWHLSGFDHDPLSAFAIWDGGLTIIGGAVFGIIGGVLWVVFTQKGKFGIRDAFDIIVPTILLAQAIGRWGNFFNHEVYGSTLFSIEQTWWLPNWIKYQMAESFSSGSVSSANFASPLFLLEGILNICGYFLITRGSQLINHVAYKYKLKKAVANGINEEEFKKTNQNFIAPGAIGASYLIVYGIIRAPLELLRDPRFNMGNDGMWSLINSLIMVGLGIFLIVLAFLYRKYGSKIFKKKKNKSPSDDESINS